MGLAEGPVAVGVKQRAMANLGQPDDLVGAPRHDIPGQTSEWLSRGLGEEGCSLLGKRREVHARGTALLLHTELTATETIFIWLERAFLAWLFC